MTRERQKELFRLCDPYIYFDTDNQININIDEFYEDDTLLRGRNWAEYIYDEIDFSEGRSFQLFTGYSGSGKTTELKRVEKIAQDNGYVVVYIDAEEYIDIHSVVDISDIYYTIIYKTVIEVNRLLGKKDHFDDEGYFHRLINWLNSDVNLKQVKGKNFVFEMKDTPTFRQRVRQYITDNFSKFKSDTKEELHQLNEEVKKRGKKGLLVIFDSLEKNKGVTTNYEDVIASSEIIFSNRDNLSLPVDVIYTVPTFLSERIRLNEILFLPAVKIKDKDEKPYEKGIEALKTLVYHRVSKDDLQEIFGESYEKKLRKIILFSGGYPRDLLRVLSDCIRQKKHPLSDTEIEKILKNEQNSFSELLNTPVQEALEVVQKEKSIKSLEDIKVKDKLLTNHLILRYRNSDLWFDIHPAVKDLISKDAD